MRLPMHTQSAIVRACTGRPVGGPKMPGPAWVIGLKMRCDDRKPNSASPDTITSSASSRRSGKASSVARVPAMTGSMPMPTPAGVSTAQPAA